MKFKILEKLGLILFMVTLATGCAKDIIDKPNTNLSSVSDMETAQKIEKFISITWLTPVNNIVFDKNKQEFTFGPIGEYKLSKTEMTRIYDNANEYKAKYEKH